MSTMRINDQTKKSLVRKKKASLLDAIKELEESVTYIDFKQSFYDDVLSGKVPYKSNLINVG